MTEPIVKVKQGKLRGASRKTVYGFSYVSFTGIPFAAPPLGKLRFKDPEPPASWEGVRDATVNADDKCIQLLAKETVVGSEDCLYLNVYVPRHRDNAEMRMPVMFWIHGGGFNTGVGNNTQTQPDYLMEKDIVLVSINYRLGALGFLNINHEMASGNQGLKDQVAALKWVKENIDAFGGDSNNVTVFGCSAGAASAHLLMISPLSKDLFHKVILQSGVAFGCWVIQEQPEIQAFRLASLLGNDSKDPEKVIEFLQTVPAAKIVEAQYKVYSLSELKRGTLLFTPTIDKKAIHPFLPRPVRELEDDDDGDMPVIAGHTSHEHMGIFKNAEQCISETLHENLPFFVEKLVGPQEPEKATQWVERVKRWYFNNEPLTSPSIPSVVRFTSDVFIDFSVKKYVDNRRRKKQAPIYLYQFSYVGKENDEWRKSFKHNLMPGATHAEELSYLFYMPPRKTCDPRPPARDTDDFKTIEILRSMWTNFAKTGNPTHATDKYVTVNWLPATTDNFYYLDIDKVPRLLTLTDYDRVLQDGPTKLQKL